jgi:hypothetical protein
MNYIDFGVSLFHLHLDRKMLSLNISVLSFHGYACRALFAYYEDYGEPTKVYLFWMNVYSSHKQESPF